MHNEGFLSLSPAASQNGASRFGMFDSFVAHLAPVFLQSVHCWRHVNKKLSLLTNMANTSSGVIKNY